MLGCFGARLRIPVSHGEGGAGGANGGAVRAEGGLLKITVSGFL